MSYTDNLSADIPTSIRLSIDDILEAVDFANGRLDDHSILMVARKDNSTIILLDKGDFNNCKATVFSMDKDYCKWNVTECTGGVELLQAMCPNIDVASLIDKEDQHGL